MPVTRHAVPAQSNPTEGRKKAHIQHRRGQKGHREGGTGPWENFPSRGLSRPGIPRRNPPSHGYWHQLAPLVMATAGAGRQLALQLLGRTHAEDRVLPASFSSSEEAWSDSSPPREIEGQVPTLCVPLRSVPSAFTSTLSGDWPSSRRSHRLTFRSREPETQRAPPCKRRRQTGHGSFEMGETGQSLVQ